MPTYQGQISEDGVIALVEYIKNLNSNYRVEQTLNTTSLLPESEGKTASVDATARGTNAQGRTRRKQQGTVKQ